MRKKLNQEIDKKIANCLKNKAEEISVSEDMFFKIRTEILKENKGVFYNMKIKFLRARTAIIAGAILIVTTATCVAATNGFSVTSHTYKNNAINTFPSSDTVKNTVGFLPKYVDNFDGGFKFDSFNYSDDSIKDDGGKEVSKNKTAEFEYKKADAGKDQHLSISVTNIDEKYFEEEVKQFKDSTEYNGIKIYYSNIKYKAVPVKYEKTDEDIQLINEGTLQIGYGSDKVEENNIQTVEWYENGMKYIIWNQAYDDVSRDAMIEMAKAVINK